MNRATEEQLLTTIKERMKRSHSPWKEEGVFLFYDMGVEEKDTHLRGITLRSVDVTEDGKNRLDTLLQELEEDRRKIWNIRIPLGILPQWREFFETRGYHVTEEEGYPAMERREEICWEPKFEVQWAKEEEDFLRCGPVLGEAFSLSQETAKKVLAVLKEGELAFIADDKGKVLSCGILTKDEATQYAGLYYISTDTNHRGKGLAKDLVAAMTNEALQKGAKNVILQASDLGKFVYDRLGYVEVGRYTSFSNEEEDQ
ncbi:MAG: GNAT family N-acetyltransferase [Tissierellia bacterium]|nr:GNAT family N-acetyltransferase [Tissierellia bacterium]